MDENGERTKDAPRTHGTDAERRAAREARAPETARRPVPGVKHEPEPDAGNIMPAEDEPGTL